MINYNVSDYAINKKSDGIVYKFANRTFTKISLESYLSENPDKTEQDFLEIKAISDEIYHDQLCAELRQKRGNISLNSLKWKSNSLSTRSAEEQYFQAESKKFGEKIICETLDILTNSQRKRYIQHYAFRLSTYKIAEREGVSQRAVMFSIELANRKIFKFMKSNKKGNKD